MAINIGIKIGTPKAFVPPPPPPPPPPVPEPGPDAPSGTRSLGEETENKPTTRRRTTSI